jgi:hypothetical protein
MKDQPSRTTHDDIEPNKYHKKSPIITPELLLVGYQLKEYVRITIRSFYLLQLESGSS